MSIIVHFFCYIFAPSEINIPSDSHIMYTLFLNSFPVKTGLNTLAELRKAIEVLSDDLKPYSNFSRLLVVEDISNLDLPYNMLYSDLFSFNDYFTDWAICLPTSRL